LTKKYYAVKKGITPGIYTTWSECERNVKGFSGAIYKSFTTAAAAALYMTETAVESKKKAEAIAYVDGSYHNKTKEYSCGVVLFFNGEEKRFSQKFSDPTYAAMRNVAGEIEGAKCAMDYCLSNGIKSLDIYYDYEGVEKWCTGAWSANKEGTKAYRDYYQEVSLKVQIRFIKVKGHSGDQYNDVADQLAKQALGIPI
jgi:ribonuclease HI